MKTLDEIFNAIFVFGFVMTLLLHALTAAHAQQATYRDAGGRTTGTASTDSGGQTTYRDAGGRTSGTATVDSAGTITFRDSSGRTVGTATAPRRW
jgi:hypothetical protein